MRVATPTNPEVLPARALDEVDLFTKIAGAVRDLETSEDVRQVIVSQPYGVIVVIDNAYNHVALKVTSK